MGSNEKVLQVIQDAKQKYKITRDDGWNRAFDMIFDRTKSRCRDLVLKYREEDPDISPHIENISNQILSNIVQLKNQSDTELFKNNVRLDLLDEISLEIKNLESQDTKKKSKKKQEKREELEK